MNTEIKCTCPEDPKLVPQNEAVDYQMFTNGIKVRVVRCIKTCLIHGYTVKENKNKNKIKETNNVVPSNE